MTSAQRKLHLAVWLVLGPIALIGLALAVVWRPAVPVYDGPLPGVEAGAVDSSSGVEARVNPADGSGGAQ